MSAESTALLLRAMGLTTAARLHTEMTKRAEAENWGYTRFLNRLLEEEANERIRRRVERLRKNSGLPATKTLGTIDEARLPEKVRRQLPTLLSGDFIRRGDNLLTFGLPGRGKTLFVAALGHELITRHQLRILFTPTFKLVSNLLAAKRDLRLPNLLARLDRFDAVILEFTGDSHRARSAKTKAVA
jgi:DNA replication protein DnaC